MNIQFFIVGIIAAILGVVLMLNHKFYKYKTSDMLFVAKLRVFLGSSVLTLFGLLVLYDELKKVVN